MKASEIMSLTLNILYVDSIELDLLINVEMLHEYLDARGQGNLRIHLYTPLDSPWANQYDHLTVIPGDIKGKAAIFEYSKQEDVDILYDPHDLFDKEDKASRLNELLFITVPKALNTQIEAYLAGYGVAWLMDHSILNVGWIQKFTYRRELTHIIFDMLSTAQQKGYSPRQIEYVRALLNKVMHVEYARDLLYHYLILKRRSYRNNGANNYRFELTYHLTNYTFFICSAMDILARLLNDLYNLGYGKYAPYGIEKQEFVKKLAAKRKTLADILALKKYVDWGELIKIRRNDFTHSSHLYMTPMVMEVDNPLSDEELNSLVDQSMDWSLLKSTGNEQMVKDMETMVRQNLVIEHNYKVVVDDIMVLEQEDRKTRKTRKYVVKPLNAVDDDFDKLREIIERVIKNLATVRSRRT